MEIVIDPTKEISGVSAAAKAAEIIKDTIKNKGKARFIAATGASQFAFLSELIKIKGIDWSKTEMFHLDEYVGLPISHKARFRKFLQERFIDKLNPSILKKNIYFVNGESEDIEAECQRVDDIINTDDIDVAFIGIGENGHIAFNDPPADFDTQKAYVLVDLDRECRLQQVGEGWFETVDDVPTSAISMSVNQIMKAKAIICTVPHERKAQAVKECLSDDAKVTNMHPSSILKNHNSCFVFLDKFSASLLNTK